MNFEVDFGSLPVLQKGVVQMPKIRYKLLCVLMALQIFVLSIGCIDVDEHFVYTPEKLEKEQNIRPAGAAGQTSAARERKNLIEYIHELDGKKRI